MSDKKQDEPRIDYEGFYKLHGHELTGRLDSSSRREIEKELYEIYDELNEDEEEIILDDDKKDIDEV